MALLRGKGQGLEVIFAHRAFDEALAELRERLAERPDFYRGTQATVVFGDDIPTSAQFEELEGVLARSEIELDAVRGGDACEAFALKRAIRFAGPPPEPPADLAARRATRRETPQQLSEAAKSLAADFAGARSDLAARRTTKLIPRSTAPAPLPLSESSFSQAESQAQVMYHTGTVRGGQTIHYIGHIVVIGDVNPGAELVASGDIVVFGSLRGVAHAGAQGDRNAKVFALELAPTQLRIATFIAADPNQTKRLQVIPEAAIIHDDRILVVPHAKAAEFSREN